MSSVSLPPSERALMKSEAVAATQNSPRRFRRLLLVIVGLVLVAAIVLGVGLGVGLHNKAKGEGGGSSSLASATASNLPYGSPSPSSTSSGAPTSSATSSATPNGTVWRPAVKSTWQIVLLSPLNLTTDAKSVTPDVSVYDIDLFTNSADTIKTLHKLGKRVICYFSAGSYEPNRPDSADFKDSDQGSELDGWPGEHWLKLSSDNVRSIMAKRIALAQDKGCDAVDPDNVDGYQNKNGLGLTKQDSIDYMTYLSSVAATHSLSIGLKNSGDIIPDVLNLTHFSVNEQCAQYQECDTFAPFIHDSKPVFHIEYPKSAPTIANGAKDSVCTTSGNAQGSDGFSTVLKQMNLNGWVEYCDGMTATTN